MEEKKYGKYGELYRKLLEMEKFKLLKSVDETKIYDKIKERIAESRNYFYCGLSRRG